MKRKLITFVAYTSVSIEVDDDATTINDLTEEQIDEAFGKVYGEQADWQLDEDEPLEEY